jgi:type II protein arginine methyltransferase
VCRLVHSEVGGIHVKPTSLEGSCKASEGALSVANGRSPSGKELTREPYTCERLTQIRGDYRALTAASPVLQFDFTYPEVLKVEFIVRPFDYAIPVEQIPLPESRISLPAIAVGQLDAIAVWFDLHLDSQNSFSTGPSCDISWEQAIFPARHENHLQDGDTVLLHASCTDTLLQMEVEGVSRREVNDSKLKSSGELSMNGDPQHQQVFGPKHNTEAAEFKLDDKLCTATVNRADESPLFYVERSELCRWNDGDYIEGYRRSLAWAVEAVRNGDLEGEGEESESEDESSGSEMDEDFANCLVLDMTHGLSPFGLMAAKEGDFI